MRLGMDEQMDHEGYFSHCAYAYYTRVNIYNYTSLASYQPKHVVQNRKLQVRHPSMAGKLACLLACDSTFLMVRDIPSFLVSENEGGVENRG